MGRAPSPSHSSRPHPRAPLLTDGCRIAAAVVRSAGPHHANRIDTLLEQVELGSQVCATEEITITEDIAVPRRESDLTAWVNVIHGCNEKCTYCVVPNTRGQEQSRTPEAIRKEMVILGEAGYKEVTLLGQNIDAYGRDLPGLKEDGAPPPR